MQEGLFARYQLKKLTKYRDIFLFSEEKTVDMEVVLYYNIQV